MDLMGWKGWFLGLGGRYGVNPIVFGAIYVGAIPFFWLSAAWLVRNLKTGRSPVLPVLSTGFFFISAYLYLIAAGRNVPAWVYAFVILLVASGAWSTARSIRERVRHTGDGTEEYDLVVIGGGSAGLTAAGLGAQLAAKTLLVERSRLGGDCTWYGCVPSKALLRAAQVAQAARTAGHYGLEPAEVGVDLRKVLERVHAIQEQIYQDVDQPNIYQALGAAVRQADALFTGPHDLELTAKDGTTERVRFRYAIIATGSSPVVPDIPGLVDSRYLTNETIFEIGTLPERLAVIGGGPIGVEMAQAFQRLGSRVTIVQRSANLLPKEEPELTAVLRERLEAEGASVQTGATVKGVERAGAMFHLSIEGPGGPETVDADAILVAAGRQANTERLGLEAAGVCTKGGSIPVDARCRTNQKHIYACGDVTGSLQFTHMAEHMAKVAVTNAVVGFPLRIDRAAVPWVTFTDPEVAHVGASRRELEKAGRRFKIYRFPYQKIDRAVVQGMPQGWIHILATPVTGHILGASIVGEGAGEMIAEIGLALKHRIPLRKIADTIHAYPTFALGVRRAADQWYVQNASPGSIRLLKAVRGLRGSVPPPPDPERIV